MILDVKIHAFDNGIITLYWKLFHIEYKITIFKHNESLINITLNIYTESKIYLYKLYTYIIMRGYKAKT